MPEPSMRQRAFPQLRMTNWKRTRAFYVDGLGFTVDWEHRFEPGLPVFAQLTRDGLSLFLTEHSGDCLPGGAARSEEHTSELQSRSDLVCRLLLEKKKRDEWC